jgi:hypothetical protein
VLRGGELVAWCTGGTAWGEPVLCVYGNITGLGLVVI